MVNSWRQKAPRIRLQSIQQLKSSIPIWWNLDSILFTIKTLLSKNDFLDSRCLNDLLPLLDLPAESIHWSETFWEKSPWVHLSPCPAMGGAAELLRRPWSKLPIDLGVSSGGTPSHHPFSSEISYKTLQNIHLFKPSRFSPIPTFPVDDCEILHQDLRMLLKSWDVDHLSCNRATPRHHLVVGFNPSEKT